MTHGVFHEKRRKHAGSDTAFADGPNGPTLDWYRYRIEVDVFFGNKDGNNLHLYVKETRYRDASSKDVEENGVLDDKAVKVVDAVTGSAGK